MQQIQQLRGADDNPRIRMITGDLQHRDPYLTQIFDLAFNWVDTRIRDAAAKNAVPTDQVFTPLPCCCNAPNTGFLDLYLLPSVSRLPISALLKKGDARLQSGRKLTGRPSQDSQ